MLSTVKSWGEKKWNVFFCTFYQVESFRKTQKQNKTNHVTASISLTIQRELREDSWGHSRVFEWHIMLPPSWRGYGSRNTTHLFSSWLGEGENYLWESGCPQEGDSCVSISAWWQAELTVCASLHGYLSMVRGTEREGREAEQVRVGMIIFPRYDRFERNP